MLAGGAASPRSDVFGLAATLWALVAGRPPQFLERGRWARVPGCRAISRRRWRRLWSPTRSCALQSAEAFARALGEGVRPTAAPRCRCPSRARPPRPPCLETIVRSAAGVFGAAAASIAFLSGDDLVYEAAWGAGAEEIVGVRLGAGSRDRRRTWPRPASPRRSRPAARTRASPARSLAESTGYVPNTMLVLPLGPAGRPFGVLQILDRLDGEPFGTSDLDRGAAVAELALTALDTHGGDTARPLRGVRPPFEGRGPYPTFPAG